GPPVHSTALLLEDRRFTGISGFVLVLQVFHERAKGSGGAAGFKAARQGSEAEYIREYTLSAFAKSKPRMGANRFQQPVNRSGNRPGVPATLALAAACDSSRDGKEFGSEIIRQFPHRMKTTVRVAEFQQSIVQCRVQTAAQHGEDAQFVIGPLDGAQSGAQRAHFLAAMKRF